MGIVFERPNFFFTFYLQLINSRFTSVFIAAPTWSFLTIIYSYDCMTFFFIPSYLLECLI